MNGSLLLGSGCSVVVIDRVALAKQGDNRLGSICLSVCSFAYAGAVMTKNPSGKCTQQSWSWFTDLLPDNDLMDV